MIKGSVKKGVKKELVVRKEHHIQKVLHMGHNPSFSYEFEGPQEFHIPADSLTPAASTKSKNLKQMPTDFTELPFVLPKRVEDQKRINKILRFSLKQQKEDEISDNPAIVTHLVSRCLTAAGIHHRIAYGYRRTHPAAACSDSHDNPMRFMVAPHVWLVIKEHVIDNTYIKHMPEKCCKYLRDHTPGCYDETIFDHSAAEQGEVPADCLPRAAMKRRIEFCKSHPDQALALGHNNEHFYNFFFAMIRHMYEEYGVSVMGIDPSVRIACWYCEKYPQNGRDLHSDALSLRFGNLTINSSVDPPVPRVPSQNPTKDSGSWRFPQCSRCMVANYCSKECQRQDWELIHEVTCLSRGSVFLPPIDNMPYGAI